jgi:hypothetical protein
LDERPKALDEDESITTHIVIVKGERYGKVENQFSVDGHFSHVLFDRHIAARIRNVIWKA